MFPYMSDMVRFGKAFGLDYVYESEVVNALVNEICAEYKVGRDVYKMTLNRALAA